MNRQSIVTACSDQVSCDLGAGAAILHLKTGIYYGLNPVGARIWNLLTIPIQVAAVRDAIAREYEVEPARCETDILDLLEKLAAAGLIQVCDA